jgi:hypothetical protein
MASIKWLQFSLRQIDSRTDFPNRIFEDMRLLIFWLFTSEYLIELNSTRQLADRLPAITLVSDISQKYSQFPAMIMMWSSIARNFKTLLIEVEGTMKAAMSRQLLFDSGVIDQIDSLH